MPISYQYTRRVAIVQTWHCAVYVVGHDRGYYNKQSITLSVNKTIVL
jgi:hypothetical protein